MDNKEAAITAIRLFMKERYLHRPTAACLYWAFVTVGVLRDYGYEALFQAGTLNWPRLPLGVQDETALTHFSYEWDTTLEEALTVLHSDGDALPEMHCWAAIVDTEEIVDLTTGFLVQQCADLARLDWPGEKPPDHVWEKSVALRERSIYYAPEIDAIRIASLQLSQPLDEVFSGARPEFDCPLLIDSTLKRSTRLWQKKASSFR